MKTFIKWTVFCVFLSIIPICLKIFIEIIFSGHEYVSHSNSFFLKYYEIISQICNKGEFTIISFSLASTIIGELLTNPNKPSKRFFFWLICVAIFLWALSIFNYLVILFGNIFNEKFEININYDFFLHSLIGYFVTIIHGTVVILSSRRYSTKKQK